MLSGPAHIAQNGTLQNMFLRGVNSHLKKIGILCSKEFGKWYIFYLTKINGLIVHSVGMKFV